MDPLETDEQEEEVEDQSDDEADEHEEEEEEAVEDMEQVSALRSLLLLIQFCLLLKEAEETGCGCLLIMRDPLEEDDVSEPNS